MIRVTLEVPLPGEAVQGVAEIAAQAAEDALGVTVWVVSADADATRRGAGEQLQMDLRNGKEGFRH